MSNEPTETPDAIDDPTRTMRSRVKKAVDAQDAEQLVALLDPIPLSAVMRQLLALSVDDRTVLLGLLPVEFAAALVEEAPHSIATELVERMERSRAGDVLDELDSDLQADLIGDMDKEDADQILAELDPEDAADVRRLTSYDDDTAGGLMVADAFSVPRQHHGWCGAARACLGR